MTQLTHISRRFAAVDPGRMRLKQATAVASGMALTAVGMLAAIHFLNAPAPFLPIGIILSMLIGQMAKGSTAPERCFTTALMILPVGGAATAVALLADHRSAQIVFLLCVVPLATWVRRFGSRATSLGAGAFFGTFFTLLLKITLTDLPYFLLLICIAVASQTLISGLRIHSQPKKQIHVLLREFRSVSATAIEAAPHHDSVGKRTLSTLLTRLDQTSLAIHSWQQQFSTEQSLGCDSSDFSALVLDARMTTEQTVAVLTQTHGHLSEASTPALNDLAMVLDPKSSDNAIANAASRAESRFRDLSSDDADRELFGMLYRCTLAHARLRQVVADHPVRQDAALDTSEDPHSVSPPAAVPSTAPTQTNAHARWTKWREWSPNTRFTVQITVAVALATLVGEAISATRWYWAVLTVFIIFLGGSSRGAILTKASRRVVGTLGGLMVGVTLVLMAHDNKLVIGALALGAAFCMMYLGPITYSYQAFFVTIMLVGLYALLGELNVTVLWTRIDETLAGCAIGVVCAYLIFSTSSRPQLFAQLSDFFQALRGVLSASQAAAQSPHQQDDLMRHVNELEASSERTRTYLHSVTAMNSWQTHHRNHFGAHQFLLCARSAEELARTALEANQQLPPQLFTGDAVQVLDTAFAYVQASTHRAEQSFFAPASRSDTQNADTAVIDLIPKLPYPTHSLQTRTLENLSRVNWVLHQITQQKI